MASVVDASLFKAYDIRGVVDRTLTVEAVRRIGAALGAEAIALGQQEIVVGRDGTLAAFERLMLEREFADRQLASATASIASVVDCPACRLNVSSWGI